MMKDTPPTLTLEATTFNKPQLQEQLSVLEQRQEAQIALAGRSNVGKSSLVNALARRKQLAKISATPGKTRSINFYRVAPDGFSLVDLPGYGYAKVPFSERDRWSQLMEGYFNSGRDIKTAFQLIDMRHKPTEFDMTMLHFLSEMQIPYTIVLTKSDKLNKSQTAERLSLIHGELGRYAENVEIIPFSSQNREDAEKLRRLIDGCLR